MKSSVVLSSSSSFGTYEATKAAASASNQSDPIHWHEATAFRDCRYRQLHHQRGVMGIFTVRLLQGNELTRSHWSPLALGPVKYLGLSKAHGAVSSFCEFTLDFRHLHDDNNGTQGLNRLYDADLKPAAKQSTASGKNRLSFVSPVVHDDNNPVWGDSCHFEFPLKKGAANDGSRVLLCVSVHEDATAVENILPTGLTGKNRLLGKGELDLTELCLGESASGQLLPGVQDAWISLTLTAEDEKILAPTKDDPLAPPITQEAVLKSTGKVRILVSYQPVGLEPRPKDVVALEAFARCNPAKSSCRPVLNPLMPCTVLDRRGSYLLTEYLLADGRKACVRLHRNAVFVIERQNIVDAATNLALLPVDVAFSTPIGQAVRNVLTPIGTATGELIMPALLSAKLLWMAARTTGLGVASGLLALTGTVWREGATSLTRGGHHDDHSTASGNSATHYAHERRAATAQFVQL